MDPAAIKTGLKELEDRSTAFQYTSPLVTAIQNRLVVLEKVRQGCSIMRNYSTLPGKDEYKTELDILSKLRLSIDGELILSTGRVIPLLNKISNWQDGKPVEDVSNYFQAIVSDLKILEDKDLSFSNIVDTINKLKNSFENANSFVELLLAEKTFRDMLVAKVSYEDELMNALKEQFQNVHQSIQSSQSLLPVLKALRKVIGSHVNGLELSYKYIAGLPSGKLDLEELIQAVYHNWIKNRIINHSVIASDLVKGFGLLNPLKVLLAPVESKWQSMKDENNQHSMEEISKIQEEITTLPDVSSIINTTDSFANCGSDFHDPKYNISEISEVVELMNQLNLKVRQLSRFEYLNELKNLTVLKDILVNPPTTDEGKIVVIKNMKSEPKFEKVLEILVNFKKDLDALQSAVGEMPKLADEVNGKFKNIGSYHNEVNAPHFLKFYDCLNDLADDGMPMIQMISVIQSIRSLSNPSENAIVNSVISSQPSLKSLQVSGTGFKNVTSPEALALNGSLPDSQISAFNLGMAVQGLSQIKKVQDNRVKLETIKEQHAEIIETSKSNTTLTLSLSRLKDLSESLSTTLSGITTFVKTINGFQGLKRKRSTLDFESNGKIFDKASSIKGFTGFDFLAIMDAVKAVDGTKYSSVIDALEKLSTMDLDFQKYKFKEAPATLKAMDLFFASYASNLAALRPQPTTSDPTAAAPVPIPNNKGSLNGNPSPSSPPLLPPVASSTPAATPEESNMLLYIM